MNKLNFNEILPTEELVPAEMEAIIGGRRAAGGCGGQGCICNNGSSEESNK